jgi:hypothetical protein
MVMPCSNVLNEYQAASILGGSVALIRKWRLFGEVPTYLKVGRYRRVDIDQFLDAHRVVTGGAR